jgi:hypothetical protein
VDDGSSTIDLLSNWNKPSEQGKTAVPISKETIMGAINSFYNPDEQQQLDYHKKLLKIADQERLARQAFPARNSQLPSQHTLISLKERLLSLFNGKPGNSALLLKNHK